MSKDLGWIGVDLDGTLAEYHGWMGPHHVGEPVPAMLERVQKWLKTGKEVRIFTARVFPINDCVYPSSVRPSLATHVENMRYDEAWYGVTAIRKWCFKHLGTYLPITNVKDYGLIELWDDRAVQVEKNAGKQIGPEPRTSTTP